MPATAAAISQMTTDRPRRSTGSANCTIGIAVDGGVVRCSALMAALPSGLGPVVLVGAVGGVVGGQLPPAWVVAQQARGQVVGDALLPFDGPEVGAPDHINSARHRR